jgi:translation initiation factor 3 subunit A
MVDLINIQKFIWETYKILLDFTKTNSKLLNLYSNILKSAFVFCRENKRKAEFKRLCDSVRGYLQTLIRSEKKTNFQNKVQFSRPEVLKNLIQIRINLLDNATYLEEWQEAFKTAEDTVFLMDKYEGQNFDNSSNNVMSNKKNSKNFKM